MKNGGIHRQQFEFPTQEDLNSTAEGMKENYKGVVEPPEGTHMVGDDPKKLGRHLVHFEEND